MTRTRRPVAVIFAGALCCFGVVLVVSYFYYVSPEAGGSIVLWGGIMCIFVGAVWAYRIATYLGKNDGWRQMVLELIHPKAPAVTRLADEDWDRSWSSSASRRPSPR
jgi:hypothetical protein